MAFISSRSWRSLSIRTDSMNTESCCAVESPVVWYLSAGRPARGRLHSALLRTIDLVALWQARAPQRREPAALDHRMLRARAGDRATAVEEASTHIRRARLARRPSEPRRPALTPH